MKKNTLKKTLSILLTLVILSMFALVTNASTFNVWYTACFVLDEDTCMPELSGIEVQVYKAEPIFDEKTGKISYYGESYSFSVYSDQSGRFSFKKPSDCCSITIVMDTLPNGYGVDRQLQFISTDTDHHEFVLSTINNAEVTMEEGEIAVSIRDKKQKKICASYDLLSQESFPSISTLSEIDSMREYVISGTVLLSNKCVNFSFQKDISNHSLQEKIDFLCKAGILSESKKIEYYCDLITNPQFKGKVQSATVLINKILDYKERMLSSEKMRSLANATSPLPSSNDSLINKINFASNVRISASEYSNYIQRSIGNFSFNVYYSPAYGVTQNHAITVANKIVDIYTYFVTTFGFNAPVPINTTHYEIFVDNPSGVQFDGYTNITGTAGTSMVFPLSTVQDSSKLTSTISHEFHHAIMATYGFWDYSDTAQWISEGFSSMASLVYSGMDDPWFVAVISSYIRQSHKSIFDITNEYHPYGALIYPLYIYENLGGWDTIKEIYTGYQSTGNIYTSITNCSLISNYRNAFCGMFTNNYKPSILYSTIPDSLATQLDNKAVILPLYLNDYTVVSVEKMAGRYRQISSSSIVGTVYMTVTLIDSNPNGFYVNKITENSNSIVEIGTINYNFTQVSVPQTGFGDSINKITLIPVNTNATGEAVLCKISISTQQ